jgi:hypothetical protein
MRSPPTVDAGPSVTGQQVRAADGPWPVPHDVLSGDRWALLRRSIGTHHGPDGRHRRPDDMEGGRANARGGRRDRWRRGRALDDGAGLRRLFGPRLIRPVLVTDHAGTRDSSVGRRRGAVGLDRPRKGEGQDDERQQTGAQDPQHGMNVAICVVADKAAPRGSVHLAYRFLPWPSRGKLRKLRATRGMESASQRPTRKPPARGGQLGDKSSSPAIVLTGLHPS